MLKKKSSLKLPTAASFVLFHLNLGESETHKTNPRVLPSLALSTMISSLKQSVCITIYCLISVTSSHRMLRQPALFASAFSSIGSHLTRATFAASSTTSNINNNSNNSCRRTLTMAAATATLEEHSPSYKSLLQKLRTITHIHRASTVINYDRQVFMPQSDKSSLQRGKQLAALATIAHEMATDEEIGRLIDRSWKDFDDWTAAAAAGTSNAEKNASDDAMKENNVQTAQRILELEQQSYKKLTCIPSELAARKAELEASAYSSWVKARETNDFASFAPALKECFDLAKEIADLQRPKYNDNTNDNTNISLYSQMLDEFEMGMEQSRIDALFGQVQRALVPLLSKIRQGSTRPSLHPLSGRKFDIRAQKEACQKIVTQLGFDNSHGRIDVSVHPFTMSLSPADVRITSRFADTEWLQGLMGTIHEGGHAMYEQALGDSDLSLDSALSMGVHESQSLFWERHVGKSKAFWVYARDVLKEAFEKEEKGDDNDDSSSSSSFDYSAMELYEAVNSIDFENLIRVEADELTYPLHVILRYNIERDVVSGSLDVEDIPTRWNADMKDLLDIDVPDDTRGALQDIHWSCLAIGYFPTYLLGSMMAAQLSHYCRLDMPDMDDRIREGKFEDIRNWLTEKVHRHGKRYKSLDELLVAQVGEPLNSKYFIEYLTDKYGELYQVE